MKKYKKADLNDKYKLNYYNMKKRKI